MYCIDTSALLHAWRRDYPPDVFKSLWAQLEQLGQNGQLIAPEDVLLELERGGDEIYSWAKNHRFIFHESNEDVEKIVSQIVDKYQESFVPQNIKDGIWADPYIIALAKVRKAIVVTGEKPVGPEARKIKIPNVCNDLNIESIDFLQLIRKEGWKF